MALYSEVLQHSQVSGIFSCITIVVSNCREFNTDMVHILILEIEPIMSCI